MTPVRHIASRPPITASPHISIREAAGIMAQRRIGLLILVEGGKLYGVVSERDIVEAVAQGVPPGEEVSKIAKREVVTIDADVNIREAATLIRRHGIRHLVVMSRGEIYGVISVRDLVREKEILASIAEFPRLETELAAAD
ncbi:MAG: CBS domain-containing protein [Pyrobaculum sp.]